MKYVANVQDKKWTKTETETSFKDGPFCRLESSRHVIKPIFELNSIKLYLHSEVWMAKYQQLIPISKNSWTG